MKLKDMYANASPEAAAKTDREIREQSHIVAALKVALDNLQKQLTEFYEKQTNPSVSSSVRESVAESSVHYYNLDLVQKPEPVAEPPRDRMEPKSDIGTPIPIAER